MPPQRLLRQGLSEAVRRYFGLTQQELAQLLGCTQTDVARQETGVRLLSSGAFTRLRALEAVINASLAAAPPPVPALTPPDSGPLQVRLAACRRQLLHLERTLTTEPATVAAARRLAAAEVVPAALAATLPLDPLPPLGVQSQQQAWALLLTLARLTSWPNPAAAAATVLQVARLAGLRAEVAALEAALLPPSEA